MIVLLTGATGYLGSHLARSFIAEGHDVIALKRQTSSLQRLEGIEERLIFYDIESVDLEKPFQEHGPIDAVVHTATCYGRAGESLREIFSANTLFPLRLLEMAALFKVDIFLNTDTFFNTDSIACPYLNGYSLSKKHFTEWGRQFSEGNQIRFVNVRLEHIYGPGDDSLKFTTWVVEKCLANVSELKLTCGEQKRDFIYVDDVVTGYNTLISMSESLEKGYQEIGLGRGHSRTVREFVETVHCLSKSNTQLNFGALPYRQFEIMQSQANTKKLELLGWRSVVDLNDGVQAMINFSRTQSFDTDSEDAHDWGSR